jgi:hypothetical protein
MQEIDGFSVCVDFFQLASGRWAGHSLMGTHVSVKKFKKGKYPDRFKYEKSQKASEQEAKEYWQSRQKKSLEPYWYEDFNGTLCQGWE